ncbi:MAG TPA: Gfo/Idh/MocA family oxidoreductase [Planctomycetota bacterium]|nr:Gfo/Idh/MocA family oxidoreductase [Planctomycetota bacterium]
MAKLGKLRAGVIGCGKVARTLHIPEYITCDDTDLVAYCDIDRTSIAETVARYGARPTYRDYRKMLAAENLDVVSVCLPNYLHCEVTVSALNAGVNVLVEKPMSLTLAEADKMMATAKRRKKVLMVSQTQRFSAVHRKAKEVIDSGMLGEILHVTTAFGHPGPEGWSPRGKWFFQKKKAGFGPMADLGIHKADLIRFLTGKEVASVSAFVSREEKTHTDVEDNFVSVLRFNDGTLGTLTTSWTVKGMETNYTYLYCKNGTLAISVIPGRPLVAFMSNPPCEIEFTVPAIQSNIEDTWRLGIVDNLAATIRGKAKCLVPASEGRKALAIILAADEAARTGRTVKVKK